ncbi:Protein winged eye [Eumeta japonica]|uniref:Protein winged eye n=1 Tax=Eumeta variegata TaxID=151549 RepID=A0A4C2AI87_EUMVA|nr:Protein winged eye [Eumeta japonica]
MQRNLLELTAPNTQALNLMRLPTPPTSATMESAAVAAAASANATPIILQTQLLFQAAASSPTPALLNLSATLNRVTTQTSQHSPQVATSLTSLAATASPLSTTTAGFLTCPNTNGATALSATIGPPTPLADDLPSSLHFKSAHQPLDNSATTSPQIVVGVPRVVNSANTMPSAQSQAAAPVAPPQMQDVNIQTDTPVCSEDENSSCPLNSTTTATTGAAGNATSTEHCTTAQCTPPLTQNDELYHDTEAQQPLELTKPLATNIILHRATTPFVESSCQSLSEERSGSLKSPLRQQNSAYHNEIYGEDRKVNEERLDHVPMSLTPTISSSTTTPHTRQPEDMTGLELLSNISASTLAKTATIRVKQEPLDAVSEANMCHHLAASEPHPVRESNSCHLESHLSEQQNSLILHPENLPTPASPQPPHSPSLSHPVMSSHSPINNIAPNEDVEPLGGLKLLCALAEQRIHEEEVQSTNMNATNGLFRTTAASSPHNFSCASFAQNAFIKPCPTATRSLLPWTAQIYVSFTGNRNCPRPVLPVAPASQLTYQKPFQKVQLNGRNTNIPNILQNLHHRLSQRLWYQCSQCQQ